jgi:DNA-binding CsgD family transcriptional regulator
MTADVLNAIDLTYHLGELPNRGSYLNTAAACLRATLAADCVGWQDLGPATQSAEAWFDPPDANVSSDAMIARLGIEKLFAVLEEHPILHRYLADPDHAGPLRISDFMSDREWRSSSVYIELFVPMGLRHQLTIPVKKPTRSSIRGWAIQRAAGDFNDADLTLASALQSTLALLDRTYHPGAVPKTDEARRDEARQRARLTRRELDVITLIADGLSAQQIARLRRISVRTVRKHLENTYAKLECHDRLLAVNRARRLGLL